MTTRIRDFALVIGHAWRCYDCRDGLLFDPTRAWMGYKLSDVERKRALDLTDDSFRTVMVLAEATGLSVKELEAAIDHPHARLRHLGVSKSVFSATSRY